MESKKEQKFGSNFESDHVDTIGVARWLHPHCYSASKISYMDKGSTHFF